MLDIGDPLVELFYEKYWEKVYNAGLLLINCKMIYSIDQRKQRNKSEINTS